MSEQTKPSSLINWVGYLGITMLVLLPLTVLTVRSGVWQQGLLMFALACLGSAVLLVVCVILLILPRFADNRAAIIKRGAWLVPGSVLLFTLAGGGDVPPIHDISTDTQNPLVFVAAVEARGADSNSLDTTEETIAQQLAAYPDITTLTSDLGPKEAYDRALSTATDLGWEVLAEYPGNGMIEAVATTAIMAFKDDIAIRVSAAEAGSVIDVRSVSRVGRSDLGANAKRIRAFFDRFLAQES
jgi:uncharacterized protein (DUF1499 family)